MKLIEEWEAARMNLDALLKMRTGAFEFYGKWKEPVRRLGESGMGYTVVSITLLDGSIYPQAIIAGGFLKPCKRASKYPLYRRRHRHNQADGRKVGLG